MDVVAALTKVVQDQQGLIQNQQKIVEQQQKIIAFHSKKITELERALKSKGNLGDGVEQTRIKVIPLISLYKQTPGLKTGSSVYGATMLPRYNHRQNHWTTAFIKRNMLKA